MSSSGRPVATPHAGRAGRLRGASSVTAAPLQIQPTQQQIVPPDLLPLRDLLVGINDLVAQLTSLVPELPIPSLPV